MNSTLELFEAKSALEEQISDLRSNLKKINDALKDRYMEKAQELLASNQKDFGTVVINDGNVQLKAFVEKKVSWDQDILSRVFDGMQPEDARHYAKITLAVEERKYSAAPPQIKRALEEARTTSVGRFTIEVKE